VIMDNLGSHRGQAIRSTIRSRGARLVFLPPHRPQSDRAGLAKLKHLMRKASERTLEGNWQRIGILLGSFSAPECADISERWLHVNLNSSCF
jgi:transposase